MAAILSRGDELKEGVSFMNTVYTRIRPNVLLQPWNTVCKL